MIEKPLLNNADFWSIVNWAVGIGLTILYTLTKWLFGDIRGAIKEHDKMIASLKEELSDIKIILAKISTKLEIQND